ncbi:hypothetical protein D4A39_04130 [Alcanivorax profundi]|uniref:Porin n=1 Tax=Alcanivorax profundi TaxID=2338368 RepID=A0A418Y3B8_9GAMM|nr:hypothetical protein [Alcanivorax profundi]RJG20032.1 hypothetical protein D4A39_04130 [Alcanivorax profundi]
MSTVKPTVWMAALAGISLASDAWADNTQAEIRRLQQQLDALKAQIDSPASTSGFPSMPLAFFGKVSVDAIYDDKDAGFDELLIPSTIPGGDTHQQQFNLNAKNSQLGFRVGESEGPHMVFAADLFGSLDSYELRIRDFYFQHGALRAGYGFTALLDGKAWPLTLDAQGPNSAIFARQTGVRWQTDHWTLALEDPNSEIQDPANQSSAVGRRPDIIATWTQDFTLGHVKAGIVNREIGVEFANGNQQFTTATGGVLSGALSLTDTLRLLASGSYGEGMAHYYNDLSGFGDSSMDGYVFADGLQPLVSQGGYLAGEWQALEDWTLAMVAGQVVVESDAALPAAAMRRSRYGTLTAVYQHTPRLSYGAEVSYGLRDRQDGDRSEAPRVQLNLTYRFHHESH